MSHLQFGANSRNKIARENCRCDIGLKVLIFPLLYYAGSYTLLGVLSIYCILNCQYCVFRHVFIQGQLLSAPKGALLECLDIVTVCCNCHLSELNDDLDDDDDNDGLQ